MRAPFPYFGGKQKIASVVWQRFGNVPNYVEAFAGSLAVLLGRPHAPKIETINDIDCMIANFWRALRAEPATVAFHADWPVNECDLHARHRWLLNDTAEFRERMTRNPDFFDAKVAGWWVWGACCWIGSGWCQANHTKLPHLGDAGMGVHRPSQQLPHLGDAGRGVEPHLKRPMLGGRGGGGGIHKMSLARENALYGYFETLAARLRRVRVCCGDWSRVLGPTPTFKHGITGVFLDPPYGEAADRTERLYSVDDLEVAAKVRAWALENGDNPMLRIALCGYEGEFEMPVTWEPVRWKAHGGYGSQGDSRGKRNALRECCWFSPHCLNSALPLDFGDVS